MTIVVTGAGGFIGSNIVAALNDKGIFDVVACDVLGREGKWRNLRKRLIRDVISPDILLDWLASRTDIRAVIHLGANSSTFAQDADDIIATNFRYSLKLLDWCTQSEAAFIYASSAATYGDGSGGFSDDNSLSSLRRLRPLNLYGWTKHLFDLEIAMRRETDARLPPTCVGLKFFNVYGPNEYHKGPMMSLVAKLYDSIKLGDAARLFKSNCAGVGDGEQKRDFVYVTDVTDVVLWFLDRSRDVGIYNLGSGLARSFNDLAQAIFTSLEMTPRINYFDMPDDLKSKYQNFTQADLGRLRSIGYVGEFSALESGVKEFVTKFLSTDDPFR